MRGVAPMYPLVFNALYSKPVHSGATYSPLHVRAHEVHQRPRVPVGQGVQSDAEGLGEDHVHHGHSHLHAALPPKVEGPLMQHRLAQARCRE